MLRTFFLIALLVLWGCSNDKTAGGNSTETENAIAFRVNDSRGKPLAKVAYRVLPAEFVADTAQRLDSLGYAYLGVSDSTGTIRIENHEPGDFIIEFAKDSLLSVLRYSMDDSSKESVRSAETEVILQKSGSIDGWVELPEGSDFAWVFFYGLDRAIKTDSTGRFVVDDVPSGNLTILAALPGTLEVLKELSIEVEPEKILDLDLKHSKMVRVADLISEWMRPLSAPTVLTLRLDSLDMDFSELNGDGSDMRLLDAAGEGVPLHIAYWDSAYGMGVLQVRIDDLADTLEEWILKWGTHSASPKTDDVWSGLPDSLVLALNSVLVADFENNSSRTALPSPIPDSYWYKSASEKGVISPAKDEPFTDALQPADSGRAGIAAHFEYSAKDPDYALVGTKLSSGKRNLARMDSLELWIRGDGDYIVALENREDFEDGKARFKGMCTANWSRVVIRPQDFLPADTTGDDLGWDTIKYGVTTLTIFARDGQDIWLDDIRIYGINVDDLK